MKAPVQNRHERLLLLCLANYCSDGGKCFPRVETLMRDAMMSRRLVFYTLDKLEKDRFIKRVSQFRRDQSQRSTSYRVLMHESRKDQ